MSDVGRKDLTDQVKETATPESQKTAADKLTESATDTYDKFASTLQPGDSKSTSQKLSDETQSGGSNAQGQAQSVLESVQQGAADAYNAASKAVTDTVNSFTGNK